MVVKTIREQLTEQAPERVASADLDDVLPDPIRPTGVACAPQDRDQCSHAIALRKDQWCPVVGCKFQNRL